MIASDRLFEPFNDGKTTFGHGYTFGGHPVSSAVALANLDIFEREGINDHVKETAPAFRATLEKLYDLPIVGDVRGEGFFYGIELVKDKATKETFNDEECERLLRGFLTPALFEAGSVLPGRRPWRPSRPAGAAADQRSEGIRRHLRDPARRAERSHADAVGQGTNLGGMTASPKPPIDPVRWQPPPVDPLPDVPAADRHRRSGPGDGPEDMVVDGEGQLWTGLVDGRIVRIPPDGSEQAVVADTAGRPLGLHVAPDGRATDLRQLPRAACRSTPTSGKLTTLVESVDGRKLRVLFERDRDARTAQSISRSRRVRFTSSISWRRSSKPAAMAVCTASRPTARSPRWSTGSTSPTE